MQMSLSVSQVRFRCTGKCFSCAPTEGHDALVPVQALVGSPPKPLHLLKFSFSWFLIAAEKLSLSARMEITTAYQEVLRSFKYFPLYSLSRGRGNSVVSVSA